MHRRKDEQLAAPRADPSFDRYQAEKRGVLKDAEWRPRKRHQEADDLSNEISLTR